MFLIVFLISFLILQVQCSLNKQYQTPTCNEKNQLYILEGRLVQVYLKDYTGPPYNGTVIQACTNTTEVRAATVSADQLLRNVTMAELWGLAWPRLQEPSQLKRVDMHDVTPIGDWGECSKLSLMFIRLYSNDLVTSPDWLNNCTRLRRFILSRLSVSEVRTVVDSAPHVKTVEIFGLRDYKQSHLVREPLISIKRGRHKYITKFIFFTIERNEKESLQDDTQKVKASTWAEISIALVRQMALLPRLKTFDIYEPKFNLCAEDNFSTPLTFNSLLTLRLVKTGTAKPCLNKLIMPQLKYLAVWDSHIFNIKFSGLYSAPGLQLVINFDGIKLPSLEFVRDDYLALSNIHGPQKGNVTLTNIPMQIDCDCQKTFWFARALHEGYVAAPDLTCKDSRTTLEKLPCEDVICDRLPCEGECVCCSLEAGTGVLADCREAGLSVLPPGLLQHTNLTRLLAPRNHMLTLPDTWPDTLMLVDLSGNNIWQFGANSVHALFKQPDRRVRLAGNNIYCSCETKLLVLTLKNHSNQIEDFENLTCAVTGEKLSNINVTDLCDSEDRDAARLLREQIILMTVPLTLIIAATVLIVCVILYYRRRELQIYMFSRGFCLCCIQEDELDADRRYDVFLSFCHEDTEFVLEKLLPILDREYAVCIHLRDWIPGDVIPSQITQSVDQSRRTVVVFSRAFVKSIWGRLEFETAHVSGLMEGRVRVVMIVMDDVLEWEELPNDLRAYVRWNTYVKLDDPWFWKKIRYALPHNSSRGRQGNQEECDVETGETQSQQMNSIVSRGTDRSFIERM